jgi:alcohol dehydrogenase (NADP+)
LHPPAVRIIVAGMKTLSLPSGDRIPALGLGTWKSKPGEVETAVDTAIRCGYRHIDCAPIYGNEREVGAAIARCIAEGVVTRDELWITSKLWNDRHEPAEVLPALRETLADLGLAHIDLFLIHWPVAHRRGIVVPDEPGGFVPPDELPFTATWTGMEAAVDAGLARNIGVSNFSVPKLETLLASARIRPAVDQVEMHPYLQQPALLEFCGAHGIAVTAYSPLGSPDRPPHFKADGEPVLLADPAVLAIAARHGVTPAQVLIAWALQRGTVVIPKSVSPERIRQNLEAANLQLDAAEMRALDGLDRRRRYVDGSFWATPGSPHSLASLWDA